ncbi:hypothetical protein V6N11_051182 [Hibiscus sabdariffa]|uniref:Reverse transcriptase n=1 Tax=Hibiscus sabdariffa TaxID=183260 RepID=A0ABR2R391_9ROSI
MRDPPTLVRLDRFLVSSDFLVTFHSLEQRLLGKSISDHNAISFINDSCLWGPRPFKFFNYLLNEVGFEDMVISNLQNVSGGRRKMGALKVLKSAKAAIKEWSYNNTKLDGNSVGALEKEINNLELL